MRLLAILFMGAALGGCASAEELAAIDDGKCQSYGAQPGSPAYIQCRTQLDATRTQAIATENSGSTVIVQRDISGPPTDFIPHPVWGR